MNREWKGHMRLRFDRKLWTLILSLILLGGGSLTSPPQVRADFAPGEPAPPAPPDGGIGDPDWPQSPGRQMKPSTKGGGHATPAGNITRPRGFAMWMKWSFRVAYGSIYRLIFRV